MKLEKMKLDNIELPNTDFMNEAVSSLINGLYNKLENYIIEGLKRKGYTFKTRTELEQFVKDHCRCEDNVDLKERVYYINDIPFFLHNYAIEMTGPTFEDRKTTMSVTYGTFAYL